MKNWLWSLLLVLTIAVCILILPTQLAGLADFRSDFAKRPVPAVNTARAPLASAVYLVIIDGLREDTVQPSTMPYLSGLKAKAAWGRIHTGLPTYSRPAYARLLSGAPSDLTGLTMNDQSAPCPVPTIFSLAADAGLKTAASAYYWVRELADGPLRQGGYGRATGRNISEGYYYGDEETDARVFNVARDFIRTSQPQLLLIMPMSVDTAGHEHGGGSEAYRRSATTIDEYLADFFRSLPNQDYLAIITADHGHRKAGGHGGEENSVRDVPLVIFGTGVHPGRMKDQVGQLDLAPTIAAALGLPMAGSMGGQVLSGAFADQGAWDSRADDLRRAQADYLSQNEDLLGQRATAPGAVFASVWRGARRAYLWRGALLRLPLALLILAGIFFGAALLLRKLQWRWPMLAGLTFPLYFYAILRLLHYDYSYSAIVSPQDCAIKVVLAALLSLFILTWAGAALRRNRESFFQPTALGVWTVQAVLTVVAWLVVGHSYRRFLPDLGWQVFIMFQLPVTILVALYALVGSLVSWLRRRQAVQAGGVAKG